MAAGLFLMEQKDGDAPACFSSSSSSPTTGFQPLSFLTAFCNPLFCDYLCDWRSLISPSPVDLLLCSKTKDVPHLQPVDDWRKSLGVLLVLSSFRRPRFIPQIKSKIFLKYWPCFSVSPLMELVSLLITDVHKFYFWSPSLKIINITFT